MDIGPVLDGMAIVSVPWSEIQSWREVTGNRLTPWAGHVIKEMSQAYAVEYRACSDKDSLRVAPWIPPFTEARNRQLEAAFGD